jgi:hypothetical protein
MPRRVVTVQENPSDTPRHAGAPAETSFSVHGAAPAEMPAWEYVVRGIR